MRQRSRRLGHQETGTVMQRRSRCVGHHEIVTVMRGRRRRSIDHLVRTLALAVAVIIAASTPAAADPKAESAALINKATEAHAAGRYDEALHDLTLAYALVPDPELLFAIGQVHMKLGDCASATTFYERFIATKSDAKEIAIARKAITTCKDHPPEKPVAPPPPPPADEPKQPAPPKPIDVAAAPLPRIATRPWYRDWIGDTLVIAGVGVGVAAALEYRSALASRDGADTASSYASYRDLLDRAHDRRNVAVGLAAGGGALVLIGVVHFVVAGGSSEVRVAVAPAGGPLVTWAGHF
jgi:tetratricopeptide (TPR) repeat protein